MFVMLRVMFDLYEFVVPCYDNTFVLACVKRPGECI